MTTQTNLMPGKKKLSMPRLMLHAEGLALLAGSVLLYARLDFSWLTFALLYFTPDLALLVYLADKRSGAVLYNLLHTIILPLGLGLFSFLAGFQPGIQVALIWLAHIGMDRAAGYGFKYPHKDKETHFSRI
ncbi:MAG: DUF4260 domain-containing protein [Candidatus Promineifilaceae bacterium]|jgi:uncharacterized membrane protein